MIKYLVEKRTFILSNKDISYVFKISNNGSLQHIYFGKRINEEDYEASIDLGWDWARTYYDEKSNQENYREDNFYNDHSLFELGSHGYADTRPSPIIFTNSKGLNKVDFHYVSHSIYKGKPLLVDQPHFRFKDDIDSIDIHLKDILNDVELVLTFSIGEDYPIILRNQKLIAKEDITLNRAYSLCLDFNRNGFKYISFPGDWSYERQYQEEPLKYGSKIVSSNLGRSSHEENPFIFLADIEANENRGEVYGFSFLYSGCFNLEANVTRWDATRVVGGISDCDFEYHLNKGEEFIFPEGIMVYSSNGFNKASQAMHNIIREHLLPSYKVDKKEAIILNSWEGCFLDFNTDKILAFIDQANTIGARMFVLDDGWFGYQERNQDNRSLGDWVVCESKIDLARIIEHCHNNNLKFGIWIEPEMVNIYSKLYEEHPEWVVKVPHTEAALSRHQFALDLTNDEVIDNVFNQIKLILDKYDIDYVKWDHNRNIFDMYSPTGKFPRNEFHYRFTRGLYKLIDKFVSSYPNILFEGCASGGGRFDLGMLYYYPQIWCSDETDPVQRLFIQYGTSYMYPIESMGAHVSKNPITSYRTKAHIALFGTYGFEFDPRQLNENEINELIEVNQIFDEFHYDVIEKGDLYRLENPFTSNHFAQMCINKSGDKAIVLFVNLRKEKRQYRYIKLTGLDKDALYYNDFDKQVHSGDYYMNIGINITFWLNEFTSLLIRLYKQ